MKGFGTGALRRLSVITLSVIVVLVTVFGVGPVVQSATGSDGGFAIAAYAASSEPFTGWKKVKGKTLYFLNGKKATGAVIAKEKIYLVKKGVSQKGWQKVGGQEFYFKKVATGKYALVKSKTAKSQFVKIKITHQDTRLFRKGTWKFYFTSTGNLHKGTVKNAHVLELDGKLYHVEASGKIWTSKEREIKYVKLPHGGWLKYDYQDWSPLWDRVYLMKFGNKKLTGNKSSDSEAFKLFKQCKDLYSKYISGLYVYGTDSYKQLLLDMTQKFTELLSYDWSKYATQKWKDSNSKRFPKSFRKTGSIFGSYFDCFGDYLLDLDDNYIIRWYGDGIFDNNSWIDSADRTLYKK
jgi:hypothetical protein